MQRALIIGAGAAGLAVAKNFTDAEIVYDHLERHADIGGVWNFDTPGSAAYSTLYLNSSKQLTAFDDFPMPRHYPTFPDYQQAWDYLKTYAQHHRLLERIEFNVHVTRLAPAVDAGWEVTLADQSKRHYSDVVIASGFHNTPNLPEYHDDLRQQGFTTLHARDYRSPEQLRDKRLLIIGCGNSGADIAADAAEVSRRVWMSLRRGYHFLPKRVLGIPADRFGEFFVRLGVPLWLRRPFFRLLLRMLVGNPQHHGFPAPDHRLLDYPPLLGTRLLEAVRRHRINIKPQVQRVADGQLQFADGTTLSKEELDLVVCATGYRSEIPFLEETPDLYLHLLDRRHESLFVIGNLEIPAGAWRIYSTQARLLAAYIAARRRGDKAAAALTHAVQHAPQDDCKGGMFGAASPRNRFAFEPVVYRRLLRRWTRTLSR